MGYGLKDEGLGWSSKNFDPNYAFDLAMHAAKNQWGMTEDEISTFMRKIEFHESKEDHTAKQIGGGPGRGLFQYEIGENMGGHTARRRFAHKMNELGIEHVGAIPEDFSTLGPQLQRAIFLSDAMAKGGNPKEMGAEQWWLDKHWVGNQKDPHFLETRQARLDSFRRDMQDFEEF